MASNIGIGELVIIGIVIMILFGSEKLPQFTKALGESAKEFKKGYTAPDEDDKSTKNKSINTPKEK